MRLYVVRHGESEADILNVHEGRADFPLTEKGQAQAGKMAAALAAEASISRIYCSTLTRARQTAAYLAEKTGAPLTPMDELREFDNGLLAGLPYDEAKRLYPDVPDLPAHAAVYGQESALAFRFRLENALSRILSENEKDATVAIVSHGGAIVQLYRAFLGLPVIAPVVFATGDTGVHCWEWDGKNKRVLFANRLSHLG